MINTPDAPPLTASASLICPGDQVTLTTHTDKATPIWPDGSTGQTWVVQPQQTTTYHLQSRYANCTSSPSARVTLQTEKPEKPVVTTDRESICAGQSVRLTAMGCLGMVRWSDGGTGLVHAVTPYSNHTYKAVCQIGTCGSDSSDALPITVQTTASPAHLLASVTNGCPYQTADLTRAINTPTGLSATGISYEFRIGPSPTAARVQSPGAVSAGTYYILAKTADGCYHNAAPVVAAITPCANPVPVCLSNPVSLAVKLDTLDRTRSLVVLHGQLLGSATAAHWQTNGTGLLADTTQLIARYLASETDWKRGTVSFTLLAPDPDGNGPCRGANQTMTISLSTDTPEAGNGKSDNPLEPVATTTTVASEGVFIPEGFSPNGDGINDRFVIGRIPTGVTVQVEVYNRWGSMVYQNDAYQNDWDGTANRGVRPGSSKNGLPEGTYFYIVRLSSGQETTRFLTLSR